MNGVVVGGKARYYLMMKNGEGAILVVKVVHSLIWLVMASCVFYVLYSGISGDIDELTWIALGLLSVELGVLVVNRWTCPLTDVAKRVKVDWQDGDDIFLPKWVAIHNKQIFGSLLVVGVVLVLVRMVGGLFNVYDT